MFTGIITDIGTIRSVEARGDQRIVIGCGYDMAGVAIGASIACSGVCLTVVDKGQLDAPEPGQRSWFAVDVSGETISRSAKGMWTEGRRLNLERSLRVGDELGGHIVTGHVDATGTIKRICEDGDSWRVDINAPAVLAANIAGKGSIAIDGVSLTVNDVTDHADGSADFAVNIIPHTRAVTTLGALEAGSEVNLEIDILTRYLARMQQRM
ncbi:riboflavin synthase [Sphingorhabdus soli]|uniref:Riboflavin synthase n=1 Tax=Flavisphingopyxis soli TaxID=2601267 RepID=A0A5C6UK13_9SPHN|nr:riboflavin synthase [Sphingorhabdus soli]TXC73342.1 riboflavin synthase [Sphingorhabdus soli]